MKSVMLPLAKVFANEKWEIRRALLLALIEGGEVRQKAKINMVDQNPSKELFQNIKSGNFGKVYLADNKDLEIEGKGDVCIKTTSRN